MSYEYSIGVLHKMLREGFVFSQSSLQDYEDCPRRFQLRYIERQSWPAVQVEPLVERERQLDRGAQFHRLVERHQLGMSESVLTPTVTDSDLLGWWRDYLSFSQLHDLSGKRFPEYRLSAEVGDVRLTATYDLLVVQPGERVAIFDWKTTQRRLGRSWFEARMQTRVYPFVLVASGRFDWLEPSMVSMTYWVMGASESSVVFEYDKSVYDQDRVYLLNVVRRLLDPPASGAWSLTSDERRCRFCEYRSLCSRGVVSGQWSELDSLQMGFTESGGFGLVDGGDLFVGLSRVEDVGF